MAKNIAPISLTNEQLGMVLVAAASLEQEKREMFLQRPAAHLKLNVRGRPEDSDIVSACIAAISGLVHAPTSPSDSGCKAELDDRFHDSDPLQSWTSDRKMPVFGRPHMIRILEMLD